MSHYSWVALTKDRDYFGGAVLCVAVIQCLDAKLEALAVRTQLRRRMCSIMQSLERRMCGIMRVCCASERRSLGCVWGIYGRHLTLFFAWQIFKMMGGASAGDWECPSCDANVFASKSTCYKCNTPRPGGGGGVFVNTILYCSLF